MEYACITVPAMRFTAACAAEFEGRFRLLKEPGYQGPPAQRDPAVIATVTDMLRTIESGGMDAVLRFAKSLDGWDSPDVELDAAAIAASGDRLQPALRQALELGAERTQKFATEQRNRLGD